MKRAGSWVLGLVVVAAMAGAGWFALRRVLNVETVVIQLLRPGKGRDPTQDAMRRGAQVALQEAGNRAGRYKVVLEDWRPEELRPVVGWIGTSESALIQGDQQPMNLFVSAFDTHPMDRLGCFRVIPGCEQQGRAAAAWAKKSKAERVFLLREQYSLRSEAIAVAFESEARRTGLTVEGPADAVVESIDRILAFKPDLVLYSGEESPYGTAFKVFSALRKAGFQKPLVMGEADPEVSFLATRPDLVDGTYLVSPFAPAPPQLAAALGRTPGPHVTAGYFAMKAVLEAIDRADTLNPESLKQAAATLPYFDAQGRAALRKCALYVARSGKFEFVELLD